MNGERNTSLKEYLIALKKDVVMYKLGTLLFCLSIGGDSIVVSISGCGPDDRGSIPRRHISFCLDGHFYGLSHSRAGFSLGESLFYGILPLLFSLSPHLACSLCVVWVFAMSMLFQPQHSLCS